MELNKIKWDLMYGVSANVLLSGIKCIIKCFKGGGVVWLKKY